MSSVNKQLLQIIWPFIFMVIFLLGSIAVSMELLSNVRAYVGGESQWSKGQKEATYFLNVYARTKFETDYQKFLRAIAIPAGDHKARIALDRSDPDIQSAWQGFIEANNHPDDVSGMISLFLHFRHTQLMEKPIEIWAQADIYLARINLLAQQMHTRITANNSDKEALFALLEEINTLSLKLTPLEDAFSRTLGEVSRQSKLLLDVSMLLMTLILLGLGISLSRRMVRRSVDVTNTLQQNQVHLSTVIDTAMDAVVEIDANGIITRWGGGAEVIFGWSIIEAIGQSLQSMIVSPNLLKDHLQSLSDSEPTTLAKRLEVQALRRDCSEFSAELTISPIKSQHKYAFCAFIRDITERKQAAEQLVNLAHYDVITGLPNRVLFLDRLDQEIKKSHRTNLPLTLMFIDIDHFKEVNDTLGHDMGDILLKEVAKRLLICVRGTDTVARFGGDEFVVILSQLDDSGSVERIAHNMLGKLVEPFQLADEVAYVSISIGIAFYHDYAMTHNEFIRHADQAMYMAKKSGRNRFNYFTTS